MDLLDAMPLQLYGHVFPKGIIYYLHLEDDKPPDSGHVIF